MPSTNLRASLSALAQTFADNLLAAIRATSIQELVGDARDPLRAASRPSTPRTTKASAPTPAAATAAKTSSKKPRGRLPRRTPERIAAVLTKVVGVLKSTKDGPRSEDIQTELKLDKREVPRVLKEGLSRKLLRSKGEKRATRYWAA